jgi:uroporphyrinogen decarboxylase
MTDVVPDCTKTGESARGISPRERFLSACDRKPAAGVALDLGAGVASYTVGAYERLCSYLDLDPTGHQLSARMLQIVFPTEQIDAYCGDLRMLGPGPAQEGLGDVELDERTYRDEWGLTRRLSSNGYYYDFVGAPLDACQSVGECLRALKVPKNARQRVRGMREEAQTLREAGYAVGAWCFAGVFEMVFWLRGYKNAYLDYAMRPDWSASLMDALVAVQSEFWEAILDETAGLLDVALLTEDFGTQSNLMISPQQFRSIVKPRIGQLIRTIKRRSPNTRILLHSDGAIFPIIGDLIDIGVDVLNPLQPGASGMDPRTIKREFGGELSFHGAIDIQRVLVSGKPEDVRAEVHRMVENLGAGGGYVVAPAHCVQPDVPPENIVAFVDAVRELKTYPQ